MAARLLSRSRAGDMTFARNAVRRAEALPTTRAHLLESAGHVFAEKGFERATAKEICERAGTNGAAVNYYFGGIDGLYAAVIREAQVRLFSNDAVAAAVAGKTGMAARFEAVVTLLIRTLTGPVSSSWVVRVIGREIVAPSTTLDDVRDQLVRPRAAILTDCVATLMDLPHSHPAVARGCLSVVGPICALLLADRAMLKGALPALGIGQQDAAVLAADMVRFALAGLAAVAAEAHAAG